MHPAARHLLVALALGACMSDRDARSGDSTAVATADSLTPGPSAAVVLHDAVGTELGTLTLSESGGRIAINGTLRHLPPGQHGIHFHQVGRCEPPFEVAGDHWNPSAASHGLENPAGPHHGDLPNLTVGGDSAATFTATTAGGSLAALLDADGAALILHADADDQRTDPSGNSGARIACGVVQK